MGVSMTVWHRPTQPSLFSSLNHQLYLPLVTAFIQRSVSVRISNIPVSTSAEKKSVYSYIMHNPILHAQPFLLKHPWTNKTPLKFQVPSLYCQTAASEVCTNLLCLSALEELGPGNIVCNVMILRQYILECMSLCVCAWITESKTFLHYIYLHLSLSTCQFSCQSNETGAKLSWLDPGELLAYL